jgi:hypothetical protein
MRVWLPERWQSKSWECLVLVSGLVGSWSSTSVTTPVLLFWVLILLILSTSFHVSVISLPAVHFLPYAIVNIRDLTQLRMCLGTNEEAVRK